jgi:hypothetical protein
MKGKFIGWGSRDLNLYCFDSKAIWHSPAKWLISYLIAANIILNIFVIFFYTLYRWSSLSLWNSLKSWSSKISFLIMDVLNFYVNFRAYFFSYNRAIESYIVLIYKSIGAKNGCNVNRLQKVCKNILFLYFAIHCYNIYIILLYILWFFILYLSI